MNIQELFDSTSDDFALFHLISDVDKRHPVADICALIYLHEKLGVPRAKGGKEKFVDAIASAEHDVIYLAFNKVGRLKRDDVVYLARCGVMYDEENDSLSMFV